MDVRPIRNEDDLTWALGEVARYFETQPEAGTPDADRFDVLSTLIKAYEDRYHVVSDAEPLDVLRHAIEDLGRTQAELAEVLGSKSRASEVLAGKRRLSMEMIQRVSDAWHIPVPSLMRKRPLADAA